MGLTSPGARPIDEARAAPGARLLRPPMRPPPVSLIMCTYNPRRDLLEEALGAAGAQSLAREDYELIVVDNNSHPPLEEAELSRLARRPVMAIREPRQGLVFARVAGLRAARGWLVVFVDDDNILCPDYLEHALRIAHHEPKLGCYGGIAQPRLERPAGRVARAYLAHLGVKYAGLVPITGSGAAWGHWEPIGAGLALRRPVGLAYCDVVTQDERAQALGRAGSGLMSGEDSLFSRLADALGYKVAYRPELKLSHVIGPRRLRLGYIFKLLYGQGRSHVVLESLMGRADQARGPIGDLRDLVRNFLHRLRTQGRLAALGLAQWDRGRARELKARARLPPPAPAADLISPDTRRLAALDLEAPPADVVRRPNPWPRISLVVPARNAADTIARALDSIVAQAYPNLQLIVMDGASTDGTQDVIARYGPRIDHWVSEPDRCQAHALNKGFAAADGDIFGYLCADDELLPGALERMAAVFMADPCADVVTAGCERVFPGDRCVATAPDARFFERLDFVNTLEQPSTLWRAWAHRRAGRFDESYRYAFDWEFWCRLKRAGAHFVALPEPVSRYYFSNTNLTSTGGRKIADEMYRVIKTYGPYEGRLADVYRFLYTTFDLRGYYDADRFDKKPKALVKAHHAFLRALYAVFDRETINAYNWNFASRQERGAGW